MNSHEFDINLNENEVREIVKNNNEEARRLLFSFPDLDKEVVSFFETNTLTDGSVNVTGIELTSPFFKKEAEEVFGGKLITTRGYKYVCSLDSSLTSAQKIKKYQSSISEVIESLNDVSLTKIEKLLLLDCLKNGLITILNSFVYQEKLGLESLDTSCDYESIKYALMVQVEKVVNCSIDLVLEKELNNINSINLDNIISGTGVAVSRLIAYHEDRKLPGFYVSRPEATHPLTIIGASILCAKRYKDVNLVVGIPSGGTEFSFMVKDFINRTGNLNAKLVLLPVSLHSIKQVSDDTDNTSLIRLNIKKYFGEDVSSVLICDDNTSTGRTLQFLKDSISDLRPEVGVYCSVAEADIVRSKIDKDNTKRGYVANKKIYKDSVNILPVSKSIDPKVDLKEIVENRKIISYYRNMEEKSHNLVDKIYARAMIRVNEFGVDYDSFTNENAVLSFHGTFLSNFYVAPVNLNSKIYPTVEHAYQAAKFFEVNWGTIPQEAKDTVREALKLRGYAEPVVYSGDLFADSKMTAGNIKVIADILRRYDYVDKDWEDKRVKIMIELLIQKFSIEDIKYKLQETKDKELIEGNDWKDTLWGVCDGKGRNILGIILMEIRKISIEKEE